MKIPSLKKILLEDISEAPAWASRITAPVNTFMEYMYQAMNRNITDADNIACTIKEITYITPSTYPTMDTIEFMSGLKTKATGVTLLQVYEKDTYVPPASAVYIPWVENNGSIIVYAITGLAASKSYIIRMRVS